MRYLIPHLLDQRAERTPDHPAVRCEGGHLSYAELVQHTNRLAHHLIGLGVQRNDRVGIYMSKGLKAVVAMYGILKAGAAYVPLDPAAPPARLAAIIQDCGIRHLVSQEPNRDGIQKIQLAGGAIEWVVGIDEEVPGVGFQTWDEVEGQSGTLPAIHSTELDLAYIIYTSGTTGTPKGIMHTHRSSLSFIDWAVEAYGLHADDCLSNHAPLHFDLSIFDFFAGASVGATTVIIPEAYKKLPASLSKLMEDARISIWYSVPAALIQLLIRGVLEARDLDSLRWIIYGGEALPVKHLRSLMQRLPRARFSQLYGVTETNVCTFYHIPPLAPDTDEPIPIGQVLPNMEALVVDEADQPVERHEAGELLIRAPAVMAGYWGRPDLNETAFMHREQYPGLRETYYRTGDLVQRLPDGNYQFLGRKDRQVKTRGFRVELSEVEAVLLSHNAVQEAVAFTEPDGEGSYRIEAAVVVQDGLTEGGVRQHMKMHLPPYAVPVRIVLVAAFPRTSAGKIDYVALRAMINP